MAKVIDVFNALDKAAPSGLAESYDNVGLLVGRKDNPVNKVLVALDITGEVIEEAVRVGAELIVSHHPIIFESRKSVTDCDVTGSLLLRLIENGISAICMHTNLDCAQGGVNDALAEKLGIRAEGALEPKEDGSVGIGRFGSIEKETSLSDFLAGVCKALGTGGVKFFDAKRPVRKVAVGGGACGSFIGLAHALGCDTIVTSDIKHNQFLEAVELSINAVDAGHFATEDIICPRICDIISGAYPEISVKIAEKDIDCTQFFTV